MTYQLHHGNMLDILPMMERESIDAIVTDPPYGLGFMGKDWDHGVPGEHFWREVYRVAKPGAHLLAFGGTRTFHRLACAIEDAGWEIRDTVMWVYGQGFPKSHDVSKAIDKKAEVNTEVTEEKRRLGQWLREMRGNTPQKEIAKHFPSKTGGLTGCVANWELGFNLPTWETWVILKSLLSLDDRFDYLIEGRPSDYIEAEREVIGQRDGNLLAVAPGQNNDRSATTLDITSPATSAAAEWDGWGTALKPSWEPVIVARKPLQGTVAENVQRYGTGAMNVDACRIETEMDDPNQRHNETQYIDPHGMFGTHRRARGEIQGRWPANLIHDGSAEVLAGFPMTTSGVIKHTGNDGSSFVKYARRQEATFQAGDTGSAARFFYCAKASKQDRDEGCEGLDNVEVNSWHFKCKVCGHTYSEQKEKSGCHCENPEPESWTGTSRNHHPTVKPTALMRYLCRLVTPPQGVILDPFMGSGSTGKAAILEGFNFVGVDTEIEYVEIAARRIEAACEKVGIVVDQPMMFETKREVIDRPKQLILL